MKWENIYTEVIKYIYMYIVKEDKDYNKACKTFYILLISGVCVVILFIILLVLKSKDVI